MSDINMTDIIMTDIIMTDIIMTEAGDSHHGAKDVMCELTHLENKNTLEEPSGISSPPALSRFTGMGF